MQVMALLSIVDPTVDFRLAFSCPLKALSLHQQRVFRYTSPTHPDAPPLYGIVPDFEWLAVVGGWRGSRRFPWLSPHQARVHLHGHFRSAPSSAEGLYRSLLGHDVGPMETHLACSVLLGDSGDLCPAPMSLSLM